MQNQNNVKNISVIVPSLNPDEKLCKTISSLLSVGFTDIICVNDGSSEECLKYFPKENENITVLTHEVNKGKGAALKTAFAYVQSNRPDSIGAVTVDGDGQHAAKDVYFCASEMADKIDSVILGCRDFSGPDVPARSSFGNKMTSLVFKLLCGMKISDTQTGLRAIPSQYFPLMLEIEGDRFEYETNMLLELNKRKIDILQPKIETVYIEENKTSHFRPIKDSYKIYSLIFKFSFTQFVNFFASSILASIVDSLLLFLFLKAAKAFVPSADIVLVTFACCALGRLFSSLFNFYVNKKVVFKGNVSLWKSLLKYYCIAAPIGITYATLTSLSNVVALPEVVPVDDASLAITIIGYCVNIILFVASFILQKKWVFKK
ncbi:MAG: glycosyltransferase [Clostridia bacterium]|nr:glycosyltransferase [Clostridia bacterium]